MSFLALLVLLGGGFQALLLQTSLAALTADIIKRGINQYN